MQAQPAPPLLQPVEADGSEGKKRRRGAQPAQRRGVRTAVNPYKADGSLAPGWMEGPDGEPVKCTGRARAAALARQAEVAEAQATLGRALSQRGAKVKAAARLAAAGMASDDSDYDVGQEFEPDAAAQPVQQPAKPGRRRGRPPKKNAEGQAVPHAAAGSADGIGGAASVAGMPLPVEMDVLFGCTKCRYAKGGCGSCRDKPVMERPRTLRWKPEAGHAQDVRVHACCAAWERIFSSPDCNGTAQPLEGFCTALPCLHGTLAQLCLWCSMSKALHSKHSAALSAIVQVLQPPWLSPEAFAQI